MQSDSDLVDKPQNVSWLKSDNGTAGTLLADVAERLVTNKRVLFAQIRDWKPR